MPVPILPAADRAALERAARAMARGEVVAFPTDTVYGIGTLLQSVEGIGRIFALKGRASEKALPVLIGDPAQVAHVAAQVPPEAERLMARFWPGALTLVLPRHPDVPEAVAPGRDSLGIRLPGHRDTRALLRALGGPMASSSANHSGAPPAISAEDVAAQFPDGLAAILDGGPAPGGRASSVVDLTVAGRPVLLREGAISRETLEEALGMAVG